MLFIISWDKFCAYSSLETTSYPMSLTDIQIKNAKPLEKQYQLTDGRGLSLLIRPQGHKWWRFKYQFNKKERRLSIGVYPDISLKEARIKRDELRNQVANGIDPCLHRQALKQSSISNQANSFEVIAREWFDVKSSQWVESHGKRIIQRLERDLFPVLGSQPITALTPINLLTTLRRIQDRGSLETAHRALNNCSQILKYAVQTGRLDRDISQDLKGGLAPFKTNHMAAVTKPQDLAKLLIMMNEYQGSFIIKSALKLAPLVFVRPGELRQALWAEIDLERAEWRYKITKTNTEHLVPLSKQAVQILKDLHPFTNHSQYVFPSPRSVSRPLSDNALLSALRVMGISKETTSIHGFRATARTLLDEELGVRPDLIEHQLGHSVKDPLGRAYNRTTFLHERRLMMQQWADYLNTLEQFLNRNISNTELKEAKS